jgi:uncharacterized membrane protein YhfC
MEPVILYFIITTLVAVIPAVVMLFYFARTDFRLWRAAFLGGVIGFAIIVATIPLKIYVGAGGDDAISLGLVGPMIAIAILIGIIAGVSEQGAKWVVFHDRLINRGFPNLRETFIMVLCFGLGWGLFEVFLNAMIMYPQLTPTTPLYWVLWEGIIRNAAILFHVASTILVAIATRYTPTRPIFLGAAISLHVLFDAIPEIFYAGLQMYYIHILGLLPSEFVDLLPIFYLGKIALYWVLAIIIIIVAYRLKQVHW